MWWTELDQSIWEKCGKPWAGQLDRFMDLDEEELIQCVSLYHGKPLKGLRGPQKARAEQQQRGWFSLWRRDPHHWVDLLTGLTLVVEATDVSHVRLGRVLPHQEGWELQFPCPEHLSLVEAEPVLERARYLKDDLKGARAFELLSLWFQRRALCFEPLERFEVSLRTRRKLPPLLQSAQRQGDALVFEVQTLADEYVDHHPLVQLAEGLGEVDSDWVGVTAPAVTFRTSPGDWLIRSRDFQLRFPTTLTFKALYNAVCCFYGIPADEDFLEFRLALARVVSADDDVFWEGAYQRMAPTERVGKHLQPGSIFHCNDIRLEVAEVQVAGPSPWFLDAPLAANQRLRRAFHSRLGKVSLEATTPLSEGQKLPGLANKNLAVLKTKEAMVVCLLEAGRPLRLAEIAEYLQREEFPLPFGELSLKKAWRQDHIMRQDSQGRMQLVAGAILLERSLMEKLSPLYGELTATLESMLRIYCQPDSSQVGQEHPDYTYGCLHGYILEKGKRVPVDWRKQSQPDLWEKLYRAERKSRFQLVLRDGSTRTLEKAIVFPDSTRPLQVMCSSEMGWQRVHLDDLLDVLEPQS